MAWEVCVLHNFALALIIFALSRLMSTVRPRFEDVLLFISAFGFGTWNHFIFLGAVLSFTITAVFIRLLEQNAAGARIFLLGMWNLLVPTLLYYERSDHIRNYTLAHDQSRKRAKECHQVFSQSVSRTCQTRQRRGFKSRSVFPHPCISSVSIELGAITKT